MYSYFTDCKMYLNPSPIVHFAKGVSEGTLLLCMYIRIIYPLNFESQLEHLPFEGLFEGS